MTKPIRIGLSGKMASGKSLVAQYLVYQHGFWELAFADKLKQITADLFPQYCHKKDRWLMIQVGECLRELDPMVWVRYLLKDVGLLLYEIGEGEVDIVVSDVRFLPEYQALKRFGFTLVRMKASRESRLGYIRQADPDMPLVLLDDPSEKVLDDMPFDYVIDNERGTPLEEVYAQVESLLWTLKNKKA